MVRRGNWSLDLGYFLQGALTIEDRRRGERSLLDEYRAALELPADEMPTAEDVWLRYRASVAHGLAIWMATLSGGDAWQRGHLPRVRTAILGGIHRPGHPGCAERHRRVGPFA
jgi:hypothetical protein